MADVEGWEARMAARRAGTWSNIDIHTEEGRATVLDALAFIAENLRFYRRLITDGVSAEHALADYQASMHILTGRMRADGLTDVQIDELIGKYREPGRG